MKQSTEMTDVIMSLDELVTACGQSKEWVQALIDEGVIKYDVFESQQFTGFQLAIVRRAARISRDFDASVPAIGLILELRDELEILRQFKRQIDMTTQSNEPIIEIEVEE